MLFHWTNDTQGEDPTGRKRFPWRGRASWRWERRAARVEWQLLRHARHAGFALGPGGFDVGLPWLLNVWVSTPFRCFPWRVDVSFHDGAVWWAFGYDSVTEGWPPRTKSGRRAWWRAGCWHPLDTLFGLTRYTARKLGVERASVPMPEGVYEAEVERQHRVWERPRWPWWPLRVERAYVGVRVDCGIPHEGKGENAYDCGEDATYEVGAVGDHAEAGVARFVESVLTSRRRYGGRDYPPAAERQRLWREREAARAAAPDERGPESDRNAAAAVAP